jgi:hypothetical protein
LRQFIAEFRSTLPPSAVVRTFVAWDHPEWRAFRRTPGARAGIELASLNEAQRTLVHKLLSSVLSPQGYSKVVNIMRNEDIQARVEPEIGPLRFWFGVFGAPGSRRWGWRLEGHHVSLRFAFSGDTLLSATPLELGAHPAVVERGVGRGTLRLLDGEEELGRKTLAAFLDAGVAAAIGRGSPNDALIGERQQPNIPDDGARVNALPAAARGVVWDLVREYVGDLRAELAADVLARIPRDSLRFAWSGDQAPGRSHSYRLAGGGLLIEYQRVGEGDPGGANHIHRLLRLLSVDFGDREQ